MNTENEQQDGGEETQIYLPDDGRNFEDKMKPTTEHGVKATCCTYEFFKKVKLHSPKWLVRISAFLKTHACKLIPN